MLFLSVMKDYAVSESQFCVHESGTSSRQIEIIEPDYAVRLQTTVLYHLYECACVHRVSIPE